MRLKQEILARVGFGTAAALAVCLFGSGRQVFAFEQQQPPPVAAPVAQPPAPVVPSGPEIEVTADEAVRMAIENNIGIQNSRLGPQVQAYALARAEGVYAPTLFSNLQRTADTRPPREFLAVGRDVNTSASLRTDGGVQQQVRWGGGSYQLSMVGARNTSDALRVVFSPELSSSFTASYSQPLLRNFRIDNFRQQILQSRNQLEIAELQLLARVTQTSRNVRTAYYNLLEARGTLDVARQSLELSQTSLQQNERRVEVGAMAQIEILEAQAEVTRREEAVIIAEAEIQAREDQLRTLVMNPSQPDFWRTRLVPTERPTVAPQAVDVEAAISNALQSRTDLLETRKQLENADINIRFAKNQKLPALNLDARYGLSGLGGRQNKWEGGVDEDELPRIVSSTQRDFGEVLRDVFGNEFRNWSVTLSLNYPIGGSSADAALAQSRLQREQGTLGLREQEMAIVQQVRNAGRQVSTTQQRVEATAKAREFAERRLEAEDRRVTVGLSTTFQLIQAQRDLDVAKQNELRAQIDYNRALVNFEAVQQAPLGGQ